MKDRFLLFSNFPISQEFRMDLNRVAWGASLGFVFFVTLAGAPFAGFLRELGVGDLMYSVMMSLPAMGGIFQILASYFLERTGLRKKMFLISGIFQRLSILPVVLLPLFLPEGMESIMIVAIIFFLLVSAVGSAFNGVSFFSWMAVLIPMEMRGRFFGQRQMLIYLSGMLGGFLVSFLLDSIDGFAGFAVVFALVIIMALLDIACFIKVKDPPFQKSEEKTPFIAVWKEAFAHPNFRKYTLFWAVWVFGLNIPIPFFIIYMLEHLKISFFEIAIYGAITSIFVIIFGRIWGSFIDRFANRPVLYICSTVISFIPILWSMAVPGRHHLVVALVHILVGMFWGGIELTSANLMMGLSPEKNRSVYIANFSVIGALAGSILPFAAGGFLMEFSRDFSLNVFNFTLINYHLLFIVAVIIRLFALLFLLHRVHEENDTDVSSVLEHSAGKLRNIVDSFKASIK